LIDNNLWSIALDGHASGFPTVLAMANLTRGTRRANSAVEECTCYRDCGIDPDTACFASGDWHAHEDEPCAQHPDRMIARL
jgi:hypothetical protein